MEDKNTKEKVFGQLHGETLFSTGGLTKLEWATIHMMGVLISKTTTTIATITEEHSPIAEVIAYDAAFLASRALEAAEILQEDEDTKKIRVSPSIRENDYLPLDNQ